MLIVLESEITQEQKNTILNILREGRCIFRELPTTGQTIIGTTGNAGHSVEFFENLPGVVRVVPVETAFKLVSRQLHPEDTRVKIGDIEVGGERIVVVAGPCAVESRQQALAIAREVQNSGAVLFRGGAFKPRTSPYTFQGLGEDGLKILAEVRETVGMPVVTEITTPAQADLIMKYVDVVQIGARNMQNFDLLKCVGRLGKPVILKRGLSATIEEWLMSAEYILSEGNGNVILCERGIRTFEPYTRNTLDLSAIPVIKTLTHLPVIIDPSHATGMREKVRPMARAGIAAGADGLMIEVHNDPDRALSDGAQSLYPSQFFQLMRDIYVIAPVVGKQLDFGYLDKSRTARRIKKTRGEGQKAACLGEIGSNSHRACTQYFGSDVEPLPTRAFREIFEAVNSGAADYGVIPLENSLAGSVHENYDLLLEYDFRIIGEITLRIKHDLIGLPGTKIDEIRRVHSHPQVFRQCRQYLDRHPDWDLVFVTDSAQAVKQIKESGDRTEAALAGREAAEIYGMEVLEEGIETNPRNFTRFVVISAAPPVNGARRKSSLVYSTGNRPGALFATLKIFADHGINLVKLESRPIHGKPFEYMFYIDLEGDAESTAFAPVLQALREKTDFLKILGSY